MSEGDSYRVWLAGEAEWEPGPTFSHLAMAIDRARRLAVTRWVAIELPTREWHVFDESKSTRLGPAQFARGSNLDLTTKARAAEADQPRRSREFPRASTGNNTYRVSGVRVTRPVGTKSDAESFNQRPTASGLGPETNLRKPASRTSSSQPVQRPPTGSQPIKRPQARRSSQRAQRSSTARHQNERRSAERFAADEVLGDPACYVEGQRADVVDVSETGLQLTPPPRVRLSVGKRTVLAFADRHGRFDLIVKVAWSRGGHVGVEIEEGGANLVGKMFLRKLIGQLIAKRERAKNRGKKPTKR